MKDPLFKLLAVYVIAIIIGLLLVLLFSSCTITRKSQKASSDSTNVSKVDSSYLKKTDQGNKSDSTWWKEIINFFPKDTVINNTTVPVYNYYPSQIIREGGTFNREEWERKFDSLGKSKSDTTTVSKTAESKSKETKVLNIWQTIGLCIGVFIVLTLLSKIKISLR